MSDVSTLPEPSPAEASSRGTVARSADLAALHRALLAVVRGDLSFRLAEPSEPDEQVRDLFDAFNALAALQERWIHEHVRLACAVRDGVLSERIRADSATGAWAHEATALNGLAARVQLAAGEATRVLSAVVAGDLGQQMSLRSNGDELRGELRDMADAVNTVVDTLRAVTSEVTRVSREVGTEGKLGAEAIVPAASGAFQDLTDGVNGMARNLTNQVRSIAVVTAAIAGGDLSQKITVEARGEILELKTTINALVERLRSFAAEVTRVAREVGTEGRLGAQADVKDVSGTWRDLTDNVNQLAGNLTTQVRNIAVVATAVAGGDLSQKITVDARGEILELKNTLNAMVDRLRSFAAEVTRVAREVGAEGKLGAQADVKDVTGTWRDLTDNVNQLAGNLTNQVRNIAVVATAVARGDLSQKISVEAKGEILELKDTINAMVDRLNAFSAEVTRIAREVGTEGKLGGQAAVPGVAGTWKELTDNVNLMAGNLTAQVRGISHVVTAVAKGDLSQRLFVEARGEIAQLADTLNAMTDTLRTFAEQVTAVAREVGTEGKLGGQARVPGAAGTWKELTENVNLLAGNLTSQVRNIALVTTAVANGDLSKTISVEAQGEILELKNTINGMVERLRVFSSEVTRVAREVGTDGKLGAQAHVPGVAGTWKELTDNVNVMASNLTDQVRGIGRVVTAVANGDLGKKLLLVARGEIAALADTINDMTDTLRTLAEQVTTVSREVGVEGQLGGQAKVPGAAGTWRDLTDNVNLLAGNLTTQVRSIAEVASSVTKGDLSREISVEARGEVLALKDTINQMIRNLRDTTQANREQDWLKSNLARFFGLMQGQRDLEALARVVMSEVTPLVGGQRGAFYVAGGEGRELSLQLVSTYAHTRRKSLGERFALGEGLVGQCALEKKPIIVSGVPDDYAPIGSGLGEAQARNIAVFPILFENQLRGVVEIASFGELTPVHLTFLEQLMLNLGVVINLIGASGRTEELLRQLQRSNAELETRRHDLEEKAGQLEAKNREIARASGSLEEKAKELAQVSQYKSQFLANMSHEIRTPLNSMMILAQLLATDEANALTSKQKEYAEVIWSSGRDLLALINQILDLSKIEAGRIETHPEPVPLEALVASLERTFSPVAKQKRLSLRFSRSPGVPEVVTTDRQLLEQILKNLLSNALKFTERGGVEVRIGLASSADQHRRPSLAAAPAVLAIAVRDSGIGVAPDKRELVFDAFQQADASAARKYGGTGLGLTISREYARVLGGELGLDSAVGVGSTFTVYVPLTAADLSEVTTHAPAEGDALLTRAAPPFELDNAAPEGGEEPGADAERLAGLEILVVDDDARNLYTVTGLLERYGAEVVAVGNAHDAYEAAREHPDLAVVLMDVMMPDIDGLTAARTLRAEHPDLPIIALTAKASAVDRESCIAAGMVDYVSKPADARHLVAVVSTHARRAVTARGV
ncbi:HAMP domain-containing protein [Sandaracinus amylolyticus]|uniref:HAMP domain-containing protein n=1 Tax=Sandaracinus amylolyticus TaxID=927083 RepID=UPI001F34736D|nr:HAMP domain-containing protein [Sandaracinus amylolyticus]UJR78655.1 Histidine kinase [Sandaracinus amylolyticus]